jgi:hypothetical protein
VVGAGQIRFGPRLSNMSLTLATKLTIFINMAHHTKMCHTQCIKHTHLKHMLETFIVIRFLLFHTLPNVLIINVFFFSPEIALGIF